MSQCTKPEALKIQISGNHYSKLKIQPMEFSMANNWDACAHTILKYVTRHRDKNGRQDLEKARHCVDMREALVCNVHGDPCHWTLPIEDYCLGNGLLPPETQALEALSNWIYGHSGRSLMELKVALDNLIALRYPAA